MRDEGTFGAPGCRLENRLEDPAERALRMSLQTQFQKALDRANAMPTQPPGIQLALYGLFKQATVGDVTGERPGLLEVRRRAKYDAWANHRGTDVTVAMEAYISKVDELSPEGV